MYALVFICCVPGFVRLDGIQQGLMATGIVACIGATCIMLGADIPMYHARSRGNRLRGEPCLGIADGFHDTLARRVPTGEWSV